MSSTGTEQPAPAAAPPKEEKTRGQPAFLDKTYMMVEQCNTEDAKISEWSSDGKSFTVKDPVKFAETYIPKFFKHSNFSSFVRQMNFYGFRKVKVGEGSPDGKQSSWQFKHPKFQRGQKHLLTDIKRRTYADSNVASQTDVDELKEEVKTLREQLKQMGSVMVEMQSIIKDFKKPGGPSADLSSPGRCSRKRPRLSSEEPLRMRCSIKAEGGASPASPFKFEEDTPFSGALQGSMFDASVEWGDVFDENFAMDSSPLPMELGSPPVPRPSSQSFDADAIAMDHSLVSNMIETLVTNVTHSAISNRQQDTALASAAAAAAAELIGTPVSQSVNGTVSPEASPRSGAIGGSPGRSQRADGGMSPMNATATPAAPVDGSVSTDVAACGSGSGLRRQVSGAAETQHKDAMDATATTAAVATSTVTDPATVASTALALQKVKLEPAPYAAHAHHDHAAAVSTTSAKQPQSAAAQQQHVSLDLGSVMTPLRPLPVHQVASRHFPTVSQRQQVALLSCMLQHFAAAVPKTLLQMQESYGIAAEESASWFGQHPLQHTPISSEVA